MKRLLILALFCLPVTAFAQQEYPAGQIAYLDFTTRALSTGAPTALSGGTIACYKNGSLTAITTGVTLTANYNSITGLNHVEVDTSSSTTTYTAGSTFWCIISAGTISGTSVAGEVVGGFKVGSKFTLQKGVAFSNYPIFMISSAGAAVTGIVPTCVIAKDNGAFAASSNTVTERANGNYRLDLTATETNANTLTMICTGTGAVPYRVNEKPQQ